MNTPDLNSFANHQPPNPGLTCPKREFRTVRRFNPMVEDAVLDLRERRQDWLDGGGGEKEEGDGARPSSGPPPRDSAGSWRSVRLKNGAVSSVSDRDGTLGTVRALCV